MLTKCRSIANFHRPIHSHWSLPLMRVNVGLIMLSACTGRYLVHVFLFLIGRQVLGHFFRYKPLLPIGWRIVQISRHHRKKTTNAAPTTYSAIQQQANPLYQYTTILHLFINRNAKNKQLTLLHCQVCWKLEKLPANTNKYVYANVYKKNAENPRNTNSKNPPNGYY